MVVCTYLKITFNLTNTYQTKQVNILYYCVFARANLGLQTVTAKPSAIGKYTVSKSVFVVLKLYTLSKIVYFL
jgi:hypothetical protein